MRKARAIISEKSKDRTNGLFTHVARHGRVRHVVCTYLTYQWDGTGGRTYAVWECCIQFA